MRNCILVAVLALLAPAQVWAAPCDTLAKNIQGQFDGGSGYTLPGCDYMPPGQWQTMEQEARSECNAEADAWLVSATADCLSFCTTDAQGNTLACLPVPVLPPFPPAGCSRVEHSITQSGTGPGCSGIQWHYNFTTTARASLKCKCRALVGGGGGNGMFEIGSIFERSYP